MIIFAFLDNYMFNCMVNNIVVTVIFDWQQLQNVYVVCIGFENVAANKILQKYFANQHRYNKWWHHYNVFELI